MLILVVTQTYWLSNQYEYSLHQYENELYRKTLRTAATELHLRQISMKDSVCFFTSIIGINYIFDMGSDSSTVSWTIRSYRIDAGLNLRKDTFFSFMAADSSQSLSLPKGVTRYEKFQFAHNDDRAVKRALTMFKIEQNIPFTTARFDSLLRREGLQPEALVIEHCDSMPWMTQRINHDSFINSRMQIVYPYNILQKQVVRIIYRLDIYSVLERMLASLAISLVLTVLLIFCMVYQIRTIFKQRRLDELRKDFIRTMIHELKRPISTLKMCISFMKDEWMMNDKAMKDELLDSSQKELDNLSSYFSKLRDLTYGDFEEVPLNLSTFDLKSLIKSCIVKLRLPTDRKVSVTTDLTAADTIITADKMYLSNIVSNLLENAVKYSEGDASVNIACRTEGDGFCIEVSDTGIGISEEDCKHVFEKYFRSSSIADRNIPGIGLGLAYVRLLVTAHKGTISLKSELGVGSTFTVKLPRKQ